MAPPTVFNSGATPQLIFLKRFPANRENLWPRFCRDQQGSGETVRWHKMDKKAKIKDLRNDVSRSKVKGRLSGRLRDQSGTKLVTADPPDSCSRVCSEMKA